jgi:hypothetical protein
MVTWIAGGGRRSAEGCEKAGMAVVGRVSAGVLRVRFGLAGWIW